MSNKINSTLSFVSGFLGLSHAPKPKPTKKIAVQKKVKHSIQGYLNEQTPIDMVDVTHLLITGSTGSGKGVTLSFLVATLLGNVDNDNFDLIIIDAKGGLDYLMFEPDTRCSIVTRSSEAVTVLENLREIHEERLALLRESKVKNLTQYKAKHPNADEIKNIIVVFDELADFVNSEEGKEIKQWLKNLIPITRAVGINFILATQFAKVEAVDSTIKMNITTKLSLKISGGSSASNVVGFEKETVGESQPHTLKNKGEFYYLKDGEVSDILKSEWKGEDNQDAYLLEIFKRGIVTSGVQADYTKKKNPTALEGLLSHVQDLVMKQKREKNITKVDISTFEYGTDAVLAELQVAGDE